MKILPCGVAVVEGDTHIGKWIEQEGRLDIARNMIEPFKAWIPKGGVVVDVGACIGDHTVTYAQLVGPTGRVFAFEPNPQAYECLKYNMRNLQQVSLRPYGLSNEDKSCELVKGENTGAAWLVPRESAPQTEVVVSFLDNTDVIVTTLDGLELSRLNFLKIDVEGMECDVLEGAAETIDRCHPAILCEVYEGALERAGSSKAKLFEMLENHGYGWQMVDPRLKQDDPFYDIFCTPKA